jgi:hypothetical protein
LWLPTAVRAGGKKIALAEIIVGPNQEFEEAAKRINELLTSAGYLPGEMEYPKIVRSAIQPWAPLSILCTDK